MSLGAWGVEAVCLLGAPTGPWPDAPLRTGTDRRPRPCTAPAVGPQIITSAAGEGGLGLWLGAEGPPCAQCQLQSRGVRPDPASRPARGGRQPTAGAQHTPDGDTGAVQAFAFWSGSGGADPTARPSSVLCRSCSWKSEGTGCPSFQLPVGHRDEGCGSPLAVQLIRWHPLGTLRRTWVLADRCCGRGCPPGRASECHRDSEVLLAVLLVSPRGGWRASPSGPRPSSEPGSSSVSWKRAPFSDAVRAPGSFPKGRQPR